ncbi:SusC/RagA family TonB-linked outer membrane protein [Sphingobacterium phlebotomi]|uniref:SusC/RagA family TonB-linked outer membrane protein n=1 Tax=Sphingobacterium phlebotomi TaxID=2605433 RepID=A0A5D4GV50_9SPHI|nr:SusC/RagA family TonB-linked outer membrane protein [Sphingobacterium phlebotomi]TYR31783.1 SusC/RagA family TonB-linked outer membrane protein [Sphingobacterium phlebotomi]
MNFKQKVNRPVDNLMVRLVVLLLGLSFQASASVYGQAVSLNIREQPLAEVLKELRRQSGYAFVYRDSDLEKIPPITLRLENKELLEVLPRLFSNLPLRYTIKDRIISVQRIATPNATTRINAMTQQDTARTMYVIRGQVVNIHNQPLPDASIGLIGKDGIRSALQTKTDGAGKFTLPVTNREQDMWVEVSYLGYHTARVASKADVGFVVMEVSDAELEEIFVKPITTGYQRIRPEHSTGAIAQLSTKEYESRISTNFLDGLVNRMPGLMINNDIQFTTTDPNGNISSRPLFNVRGISTMSANQQPLIVIDGYPTELTLNMIDPNEIESITLLKDAAAATVYGVRASNGVIVIERKQAELGSPKFSFRATVGITPEENYSRYRWAEDASAIVTDYERALASNTVNSTSWGLLATPNQGTIRRSQAFHILAQQAANMITDEQAERAFDAMKSYDNLADYQRLFTRTAVAQTYNFNVSGGSHKALYYITANYTKNNSSNIGNDNNRFLLSARTTLRLADRLSLELTTDYQEQRSNGSPVPTPSSFAPYERYQDVHGRPAPIIGQGISPWYNNVLMAQGLDDNLYYPLIDQQAVSDRTRNVNNRITANFNYDLGQGFDLAFGGIYETSRSENRYYASENSSAARAYVNSYVAPNADGTLEYLVPKGGYLRQNNDNVSGYTLRAQLNYNKAVAPDHNINGILGAEVRNLINAGNLTSFFGYNDETLLHQPLDFSSITTGNVDAGFGLGRNLHSQYNNWFNQRYVEDRFVSAYANLVYSYKSKYSLTGSMRIDQSNLFGTNPKYKYKPLWSLGAAWNMHQEDFMQEASWINQLKLRLAYGFNGNVAKMSLPQVIASNEFNLETSPNLPSLRRLSYANSSLRWEQTSNFNVGLDYRIFRNITGNVDYYQKNSTDLMGQAYIDPTIGVSPTLINTASITNRGFEIGIRADWIAQPNFNWNTGIVVGHNTSKVTEVYQRTNFNPSTLNEVGYVEGYPVGALFAFRDAGLDSAGYPLVQNETGYTYHTDNNSTNNPTAIAMASDTSGLVRYMGTSLPTVNIGLSNRVDFGRFYVFAMINYYGGFKIRVPRPNPASFRPLEGAGNYWRQPGDETHTEIMSLPAFTGRNSLDAYNYSDKYVVNGDYMTLGDLTVSYRIDHVPFIRRAGFRNFEIKAQASNIYTVGFNKYNYSMATRSYAKSFVTPTYTLAIFTNF